MVFAARKTEKEKTKHIETDTHIICCILKQMKQEKDIVGKKYIQMVMVLQHLMKKTRKKYGKSNVKDY